MYTKLLALALSVLLLDFATASKPRQQNAEWPDELEHILVFYLENWSFDGLFGFLPGVDGLQSESAKAALPQADKNGVVYETLPPDPNGVIPPNMPNAIIDFEAIVKNASKPLPPSDITHRFFHEQYQINNGKMDRFIAWCSGKSLAYSYYDISDTYFGQLAKNYTVLDHFFHSAFGGSFLNHQWLIAARTPTYPKEILNNNATLRSMLVATFNNETGLIEVDNPIYYDEEEDIYWAVNHIESENYPLNPATNPVYRLPSLSGETIGDKLTEIGVSWRWYAGGYDDAMAGNAPKYSYHHQPFVFYDRFKDPYSWDRIEHLKDEKDLLRDLETGNLPKISWWKPYGLDNFHPGTAPQDLANSQKKLEEMVSAVQKSRYWNKSMIIITFDENGGRYDHVPPPVIDRWGPGTRIPAVVVSPFLQPGSVDSTVYETISVLRFIEEFTGTNGTLIPPSRQNKLNSLALLFKNVPKQQAPASTNNNQLKIILAIAIPAGIVVITIVIVLSVIRCRGNKHSTLVDTVDYTRLRDDSHA